MKIAEPVQSECEVSVAMPTILITHGHKEGRQQKKLSSLRGGTTRQSSLFLYAFDWLDPNVTLSLVLNGVNYVL